MGRNESRRVKESRVGANRDGIVGFKHSEHDRIDLTTIDADKTAGGNQAFDLIGTAAFSGAAGELRFAGGLLQVTPTATVSRASR